MSLVVDATPLSTTANSYISLAEMEGYVADQVVDESVQEAWADLTETQKSTYLIRATTFLDNLVTWIGDRYSRDQKLKWPRYNAQVDGYYIDSTNELTVHPRPVAYATAEMAIFMMDQEGVVAQSNSNARFNEISVGPLRIDFNTQGTGPIDKYFPDIIAILLKDYGTIDNPSLPNTGGIRQVRLIRA